MVSFAEPIISSSTSQKQLGSSLRKTKQTTNNSVSTSTGVSKSTKSCSYMYDARHELCFLKFVSDMNASSKSKSVKKTKRKEEWKPTGKVFTKIAYVWRPTRRTFSLVGNRHGSITWSFQNNVEKEHFDFYRVPMEISKKQSHKPVISRHQSRKTISSAHGSLWAIYVVASEKWNKYNTRHMWMIFTLGFNMGWKFLASKDEAPHFIIKFLKWIQVRLNATVRNIRTDNGTEFVNQILRGYYEQVGISHETSVAGTPQQNGVVERRNSKANIGIFIGYVPKKIAYHIYNRRTRKIIETIHVDFDELAAMAFEQLRSGPGLQCMTRATSSSALIPNPPSSAPFIPPSRHEWDLVFQPVFDEFFSPPASVASPVLVEEAPSPVESTCFTILKRLNDPYFGIPIPKTNTEESSSSDVIPTNVHSDAPISEHLSKWTKDHPLQNIIGDPSRPVSTRLQLHEQALFCYYDAFLTSVEPNTYKDALTQSCWIKAMQEELHDNSEHTPYFLPPRI
ncbi:retrovirus-related pol polyprotein from transposon TNT 1-94 [Tanacetum coccineum]